MAGLRNLWDNLVNGAENAVEQHVIQPVVQDARNVGSFVANQVSPMGTGAVGNAIDAAYSRLAQGNLLPTFNQPSAGFVQQHPVLGTLGSFAAGAANIVPQVQNEISNTTFDVARNAANIASGGTGLSYGQMNSGAAKLGNQLAGAFHLGGDAPQTAASYVQNIGQTINPIAQAYTGGEAGAGLTAAGNLLETPAKRILASMGSTAAAGAVQGITSGAAQGGTLNQELQNAAFGGLAGGAMGGILGGASAGIGEGLRFGRDMRQDGADFGNLARATNLFRAPLDQAPDSLLSFDKESGQSPYRQVTVPLDQADRILRKGSTAGEVFDYSDTKPGDHVVNLVLDKQTDQPVSWDTNSQPFVNYLQNSARNGQLHTALSQAGEATAATAKKAAKDIFSEKPGFFDPASAFRSPNDPIPANPYAGAMDGADRMNLYGGENAKGFGGYTEDPAYAMSHRPSQMGPGHDISMGGESIPADVYDHPEWYFNMKDPNYQESFSAIQKMRGNPDAEVTIYRAAPKNELNGGDWVTLSKGYAQQSSREESTPVHSFKVKAKDIQFAGDDLNEFGYFPSKPDTFTGPDGKTRFEIDDSNARMKGTFLNRLKENQQGVPLKEVFNHDELYKQYPEIGDITLKSFDGDIAHKGSWNPDTQTLELNSGLSRQEMRSTILHEIQHVIQDKEGFARGGNPGEARYDAMDMQRELVDKNPDLKDRQQAADREYILQRSQMVAAGKGSPEELANLYKRITDTYVGRDEAGRQYLELQRTGGLSAYRKLAGEVESRDVQARMDLNPAQRQATEPYSSQGIPVKDMIVRFGSGASHSFQDPEIQALHDRISGNTNAADPPITSQNTETGQETPKFSDPDIAAFHAKMSNPEPTVWAAAQKTETPVPEASMDPNDLDHALLLTEGDGKGVNALDDQTRKEFQQWVNSTKADTLSFEGDRVRRQFTPLDEHAAAIDGENTPSSAQMMRFQADAPADKTEKALFANLREYFDQKYQDLTHADKIESLQEQIAALQHSKDADPGELEALQGELSHTQATAVPVKYQENYLKQMWADTPQEMKEKVDRALSLNPSLSKEKIIADYQTGIQAGLTPRYTKLSDIASAYEKEANRAIADTNYLKGGLERGLFKPKYADGFEVLQHFPDQNVRYERDGKMIEHTGPLYAPKPLADIVNNHMGKATTLEGFSHVASELKNIVLSGGVPGTSWNFHGFTTLGRDLLAAGNPLKMARNAMTDVAAMTYNPLNREYMAQNADRIVDLLHAGLTLSSEGPSFAETKASEGALKAGYEAVKGAFENSLFQGFIPATKSRFAIEAMDNMLQKGVSKEEAAVAASHSANTLFGGNNIAELGADKNFQNVLRSFFLAPDTYRSLYKTGVGVVKAIADPGNPEYWAFRSVALNTAAAYTLMNLANKASSGHWMFQNAPGHTFEVQAGFDQDGNPRYIRPLGQSLDFVKLPMDAVSSIAGGDLNQVGRIVENRLTPLVSLAIQTASNTNPFGGAITKKTDDPLVKLEKYGANALGSFTPQPIAAAARFATGQMNGEQALASGLEMPVRYGRAAPTQNEQQLVQDLKATGASGDQIAQQLAEYQAVQKQQTQYDALSRQFHTAISQGNVQGALSLLTQMGVPAGQQGAMVQSAEKGAQTAATTSGLSAMQSQLKSMPPALRAQVIAQHPDLASVAASLPASGTSSGTGTTSPTSPTSPAKAAVTVRKPAGRSIRKMRPPVRRPSVRRPAKATVKIKKVKTAKSKVAKLKLSDPKKNVTMLK